MSQSPAQIVTDEEIDAALNGPRTGYPTASTEGPRVARSAWVIGMTTGATPTMTDKALCELATEEDPAGPLATINALLAGLMLRHADDSATLATLIAIQDFHLLNLLDDRDAELRDALMRP